MATRTRAARCDARRGWRDARATARARSRDGARAWCAHAFKLIGVMMMMMMMMTMMMTASAASDGVVTSTDGRRSMRNFKTVADERVLFDTLRARTAVVALLTPGCEVCEHYAEEFQFVAELFENHDDELGVADDKRVMFIAVPDAASTPNITGVFRATNAPFVAVMKRHRWYYVTPSGETVIRKPKRYLGKLTAKDTIRWLNDELGLKTPEKRVVFPKVVDDLTQDTIDAYVQDENYDVLVEFYAKWCGHCQAFEKDYEQVGAHFALKRRKEGGRVKVGRLDVDAARPSAQKYNITGLPSVQFFPRGYKARGIDFKGSKRTTQRVIDFVESPQVKVDEMKIKDIGAWECFDGLRDEGLMTFDANLTKVRSGGAVDAQGYDAIVHHVFNQAKALADRQEWRSAMVIIMCMESTPQLKNTPSGNSAQIWNFLDNVKFHVENPMTEEDEQFREEEYAKYLKEDGEMDWAAFRSDQAEKWRAMRKDAGDGADDVDDMFDDEDWFEFQYPEDGGARVEIPNERDEL